MAKKKKLWILVSALAVVLAAAVTAGALFLPGIFGWDRSAADPYVKWYSEETTEYVITTADQLYDMAYLSSKYDFEGQTFVLGADIVINEGDAEKWLENAPDRLWYPIKGFAGTFDGQGHTISGLYSKVFNEETGLFSETHRRAVVKNLKVVNSLIVSYGEHPAGFISANGAGTFDTIYTDGILWADNWNNGGIMGAVTANGDTLFTNCWFDGEMILKSDQGRVAGGIVGDIMMQSGICTIEHCLSTGTFSAEAITNTTRGRLMDIGGLVGRASGGTTNITDCFANTNIDSWCIEGVGTLIGSAGKGHSNITHSYVPKHERVNGVGYRYSGSAGDVYTYEPEFVTGFNAYKWTTLDFEEFWAVDEDGTPILQVFADTIPDLSNVEREIDTSWYTKVSTYRIKNYKQLLGLHVVSQFDNLSGKVIMLMDDIVVNEGDASEWRENAPELSWKGIGSGNVMFAGTFDGGGHSISGLYWKEGANGIGFIRAMRGGIVRNFSLVNSYFESNNVEVNNQSYSYIGAITAFMQDSVMDRVYSDAIVVNDGYYSGGLCGLMRATGTSSITNSWFDGKIIMHGEKGMTGAGILGCVWNGVTLNVAHCLSTAEITSESGAWGANQGVLVGLANEKSIVTIEDCLAAGSLTVLDGKTAGNGLILGRSSINAISLTMKDLFAIKCKNPEIKNAEGKEWLANWALVGTHGIEAEINGAVVALDAKYLTGFAAYQYSTLDFENYWDVDPNGHPVLKAFNENEAPDPTGYGKMVDYSWYNSTKDTYYISNRKQLMGLSFMSTGANFKGKTFYQTANITINSGDAKTWEKKAPSIKWIPIGNADVMFQGTYNGGGHTISGIYVKDGTNGLGLFGMIKDATIKNLKLKNSYVESNMCADTLAKGKYTNYNYIGGIAAYAAKSTFDTIYTDVIIKNDGEITGGIVGLVNSKDNPVTIRKCWFDGTIIQDFAVPKKDGTPGANFAGGFIAILRNTSANIEHCLSTGTFMAQNIPDGTWGTVTAGFVARIDKSGTNPGGKLTIKDSLANIKIEGYPNTIGGNGTVISQANPDTYLKLDNVFAVANAWPTISANRTVNKDQVVESVLLPRMTGANAYMFSTLDFKNYWSALEGKTPELKCFATGTVADPEDAYDDRIPDTSWYSDSEDEFVISNSAELLGFAELSKTKDFAGKTVKLGADIALNYGTATTGLMDNNGILAGVDPWTPIGTVVTPFRGVFDGQGYSISGLAERASGQSALFSYVEDAFIQNVTIERSIFRGGSGGGKSAAIAANTAGTTTIKRVKIADSVRLYAASYQGGIVAYNTGNLIIDNVWSDVFSNPQWVSGAQVGGILGGNANTAGVTATISNALFTGEYAGTVAGESFVGGLVGVGGNNAVTTVKDSLSNGVMSVVHGGETGKMYIGTLFGTKAWTAANTVMEDVYATVECGTVYKVINDALAPADEYFGTIRDDQSFDSGVYVVKTEDILGELAKTNASGLDYENYWITVEGKTPELLNATSGEPTPNPITEPDKVEKDTSWYNDTDTEFVLMDAADLNGFALLSQTNNFAGKTVKLGADITVNEGDAATWVTTAPEIDWTPIGTQTNGFQGTFDGQGHTISGLYMDDDNAGDAGYGLVGCINGGTVTNIKLVNSAFVRNTASTWTRSASIVGTAYKGTISNIYSDAYIYANGQWAGGIVGIQRAVKSGSAVVESELVISNCWYNGVITATSGTTNIGGIMGGTTEGNNAQPDLTKTTIDNCLFTGHILSDYSGAQAAIGGIYGYTANTTVNITDSMATGSIVSETNAYVASSYGYKNWASKVNLTDVYVAEDTAKFAYYNVEHNISGVTLANIKAVAREDILGDLAKTNASGLDFTNTWAIKTDDVPVLKAFSDCVPMEPIIPEVPAIVPDTSWYDSSKTEFVISTAEELYGLAELSQTNTFAGKTIKLGADIVVNEGDAADWATTAPERVWTAIASSNTFEGTFDGQGHTISGLYANNTNNGYAAFIGMAKGATIKNVKIVNTYFKTTINGEYNATTHFHTVAAIIGRANKGTMVEGLYSDAILIGGRHTGMIGFNDDTASAGVTVMNCWFAGDVTTTSVELDGRGSGGIMGQVVNNQISTFENCLFTGKISGGAAGMNVGGILGTGPWNATVVMKNCLSAGDMSGVTIGGAGSVIGNNPGGNKSTYTNVYGTSETHANLMGAGGTTFTASAVAEAEILGELAKTKLTGFDFDTIWTTVENGVPVLRMSAGTEGPAALTPDTSWYSDSATEFTIDTAAELLGLAELAKTNNFSGKTIKLDADITFNEGDRADWATTAPANVWVPIGNLDVRFAGTFDGQGHTISGLYFSSTEGYVGMFGVTMGATIKDFKLVNSYFKNTTSTNGTLAWSTTGAVIGMAYGANISDIYTDAYVSGGSMFNGGLVGLYRLAKNGTTPVATSLTISGSWFDGELDLGATGRSSGGILGGAAEGLNGQTNLMQLTIENCLMTGKITGTYVGTIDSSINSYKLAANGGLMGNFINAKVTLKDILVAGELNVPSDATYAGALYGFKNWGVSLAAAQDIYVVEGLHDVLHVNAGHNNMVHNAVVVDGDLLLGDLAKDSAPGLDYENIWITVENKLPELKKLSANNVPAVDPTVETTEWYGDGSATEYTISTVGELKGFVTLSQTNTFSGKTIKLGADIVWNEGDAADWATTAPANVWTPIGSNAKRFAGTFDGQGHNISGLYAKDYAGAEGYNYIALFHSVQQGTIKNLSVTNTYFEYTATDWAKNTGVLIGCAYGATIENVYSDAILTGGCYIGMVAMGRSANALSLNKVWFDGTINLIPVAGNANVNAGGLFGASGGGNADTHTIDFTDCLFTGTIQGSSVASSATNVGGLAGHTFGKMARVTTTNCLSAGTITATGSTGPAIGAVFGNTFWQQPAKNFISNVYWTSETYSTPILSSRLGAGQFGNGAELNVADALAEADILGDLAKTKLTGFDFDTIWATNANSTPVLKAFVAFAPVVLPDDAGDFGAAFTQLITADSYDSYAYGEFGGVTATDADSLRILAKEKNGVSGFMLKKSAVEKLLLMGKNEMTFTMTPSAYNSNAVPTYIVLDSLAKPDFVVDYETVAAKVDGSKLYFAAGTKITIRLPQLYADMTAENGLKFALLSGDTWASGGNTAYLTLDNVKISENLLKTKLDLTTSTGDFFGYYNSQGPSWPKQTELALRAVADAGFKYIDLDFYQMRGSGNYSELMQDGWEQIVNDLKALAEELDIEFRQAHSPGYCSFGSEEWVNTNKRCIEVCEMLGIDDLVVHSTVGSDKANCFQVNANGYAKILPYAEAHNVNVLCENSTMKNVPAGKWFFVNGADTREFVKYVREQTGCESFACCWDTGHGNCEGDQYLDILAMGDAMKAIHFNDNTGSGDTHLMTYYGNMDVDRVLRAMMMMGFNGDFTLEVTGSDRISTGYHGPELEGGLDPYTTDRFEQEEIAFQTHTYILEKYAGNIPLEAIDNPNAENTLWYNDAETEFVLTTAGELKGLAALAKTHDFAGKTIKLGADITFNEGDATTWANNAPAQHWRPISQFKGTFDGQGHTISGLYYLNTAGSSNVGFFGTVENAVIKNLIIDNSCLLSTAGSGNNGIIAGLAKGITVENVKVTESVTATNSTHAGIVAYAEGTNPVAFKNVWMAGTITNAMYTARFGGLMGYCANTAGLNITMENCLFTGVLSQTYAAAGAENYVGGLIGSIPGNVMLYVSDSLSAGSVSKVAGDKTFVGSVIGITPYGKAANANFKDVYATTECYEKVTHRDATQYTGTITQVASANLLGDLAKTNAPGLDYVNVWTTVAGKTPELRHVAEELPDVTPEVDPNEETTAWYDASKTEFTLNTLGEFKGFVTLSKTNTFSGKTVKLGADIVWNEGNAADWTTTAPANAWTPIGNQDNGFLGTFDGQGHTISGLYCVDTGYASFVARLYNPGVVKNVNIVNSYFRSNGNTRNYSGAGIVSRLQGGATVSGIYTDAIFEAVWDAGIVASVPSGTATITNCWFDGTVVEAARAGGILGFANASDTYTITNCLSTGSISGTSTSEYAYYGGLVGVGNYNTILKVTNCLSDCDMSGVTSTRPVGSVVGNNPGGNKSVYSNVYATTESHANMMGAGGTTFPVTAVAKADILGDLAKTKLTGFDFTDTWATVEKSTPVLKAFAAFAPVVVDPNEETTEWYGDGSATEYTISTVGELKGFVTLSKTNTFSGKTVKLGADIVWNEGNAADWATTAPANAWTPIAPTTGLLFQGTFDGQGHTISGLYCVTNGQIAGLFGAIQNATIKNINVTNSYFKSGTAEYWDRTGVIGYAYGTTSSTIENIYTNAYMVGGFASGLVAHIRGNINIDNCWNDGNIQASTAKNRVGGIVGFLQNASTATGYNVAIENCLSTVTITGGNASQETMVGGIIGSTFHHYTSFAMTNCLSAVDMSGVAAQYIGSVYGHIGGSKTHTITGVYATTESYSNAIGAGTNYTGAPVKVATADILGDAAKTKLTGFDFENTWTTVEGKTPVLKTFAN